MAVEIRFAKEFAKQLPLTQIKADPVFANWDLVKQSRLSVMPVSEKEWARIMQSHRQVRVCAGTRFDCGPHPWRGRFFRIT